MLWAGKPKIVLIQDMESLIHLQINLAVILHRDNIFARLALLVESSALQAV